jgi:sugar (pentulose or hexulose) kinase
VEGDVTDLLVGLDAGTTFCKAAVVTPDGVEVAHGRRPTPWVAVPTGAEVDPDTLARACVAAAADALRDAPAGTVRGVGVCSMGETGVMLDAHGDPLAPGIAWHDSRGGPEAERMAVELGAEIFTRRTGLPVGPFWTAPKVDALLAERPDLLERGRCWLSVAEWIVAWLGGERVAELSLASRTGLLDVIEQRWWPDALARLRLRSSVMPPLIQAGSPVGRVTRVPHLQGAVLTVAGHDHPCASVGAGAVSSGDVLDSCGTAEAIVRSTPAPAAPEVLLAAASRGITTGCHVVPERHVLLGYFKAGLSLRRILRLLGTEELGPSREALDREALHADVGSLRVLGMAEELQTVQGIGDRVTRGGVWRAALEATAHETSRILAEIAAVAGPSWRLVVTGGWARSEAYVAIKREVLGSFQVPAVQEAGARGAALLAGLAAGLYGGIEDLPRPATTSR